MKKVAAEERTIYDNLKREFTLKVTQSDLDAFDDSSFTQDRDLPEDNSSIASALCERLGWDKSLVEPSKQEAFHEVSLFEKWLADQTSVVPEESNQPSRKQFKQLQTLVVQAFTDVCQGWSLDYVILNQELDLDFLRRCWQLGAAATPEVLNQTLMNARKSGLLKSYKTQRPFSMSKGELDSFSFAVEMALREIQDRIADEAQGQRLSLDKILCSPKLASTFDCLSRHLAPGYTSTQYRWAAMALRKARRLTCSSLPVPLFEEVAQIRNVLTSQISQHPGIYLVRYADDSSFIGVANNLRVQVDSLIGRIGKEVLPDWVQNRPSGNPILSLLEMPGTRYEQREHLRANALQRWYSRLNFLRPTLFNYPSSVA